MIISFFGGMLLGMMFFGGLYWTTLKVVEAKRPEVLFLASGLIRTILLLGGLFLLMDYDIKRLFVALAGVFLVKFIITRRVKKAIVD